MNALYDIGRLVGHLRVLKKFTEKVFDIELEGQVAIIRQTRKESVFQVKRMCMKSFWRE